MKFPNSRWFSKVLKEYKTNSDTNKYFICECSCNFRRKWNDYFFESKMKEYARKWIELNGYSFIVGNSVLFREYGDFSRCEITINFLSWLIKELKKEELPSARWFKSVLKEFKAHESRFICHACKKFSNKWDKEPTFAKNLSNNAKVWVQENSKEMVIVNERFEVLFESNISGKDGLPDDKMREIKIEFLSWLIKKLEN